MNTASHQISLVIATRQVSHIWTSATIALPPSNPRLLSCWSNDDKDEDVDDDMLRGNKKEVSLFLMTRWLADGGLNSNTIEPNSKSTQQILRLY